ncbi:MAG TPA: WecB/TagA/CpsF family glycosyltransferase [Candidatus Saccharimonadales bacterium]|nr:WecB/TagA/CpsF family glycosyltransferase [Candidatus Saccharimonadales bacterium]
MDISNTKTNYILGVKVDFGHTVADVLMLLESKLNSDAPNLICTTNPEFIMQALHDSEFRSIINSSTLSLPDGYGVILAYEYLVKCRELKRDSLFFLRAFLAGLEIGLTPIYTKNQIQERMSGSDLIYDICKLSEQKGYSIYLLGGQVKDQWGRMTKDIDLATYTAETLRKQFPKLNIIGATSKFSYRPEEDILTQQHIFEQLKNSGQNKIDFLFVAYGHGNQEKWIARNASKINAKVCLGVGGSFEFITGAKKRAPLILRRYGLEYIYRLLQEPWRLKRVVTAFPIFPVSMYFYVLRHKSIDM